VWLSVSATTRAARPGEVDGVNYRFVTDAQFDDLIATGQLLEWAEFSGNRYGTPRGPVDDKLASGVPVLLEVELVGARSVREAMPEALLVFLEPPSWAELERRLSGRGTESREVVERRLEIARTELAAASEFDVVLVNSDVEVVCAQLVSLMGVQGS
jgi:guanylate kinase